MGWKDAPEVKQQSAWMDAPEVAAATSERPASTADKIAGSRIGRLAGGAASLVTGPLQLGAHLGGLIYPAIANAGEALGIDNQFVRDARSMTDTGHNNMVADAIDEQLRSLDEAKKRGMKSAGNEGTDWMGILGSAATGVAATKGIPLAATLLGKAGQGAAIGAWFGAASPVSNGGEAYWGDKASQVGVGAALGGALPVAVAGLQRVGSGARDIVDVLTGSDKAVERLTRAYYKKLIGEENIKGISQSLRTVDEIIPGGKPTAAEAVSNNPFGTALQAQQAITARTKGGISGLFNNRANMQAIARESADMEMDAVTGPMREAALDAATRIKKPKLTRDLIGVLSKSETKAVTPARQLLSKVADDINNATDARGLYAVRKYIGDLMSKRVDSPDNVAGYASTQLKEMKGIIDNAIRKAGAGELWDEYLSEYAKRAGAIESSLNRSQSMYAPLQKTSIPGADAIAEGTQTHLPNLLSREAMVANWLARAMRGRVEPKIDAAMAEHMLNPAKLADVLDGAPVGAKRQLIDALLSKYGQRSAIGAATTAASDRGSN